LEHVYDVVSNMTKIPVNKMSVDVAKSLLDLDKNLNGKVIGQDDAVIKIAKSIKRNRLGIKDPNRPIGSFVFLGSTGVGKTYLAKQLAKEMFGSEESLIRVDMSEYQEKHSISKLVGAPPGYVGYEEGGMLTEKVKNKPYSVILFDEVEKAVLGLGRIQKSDLLKDLHKVNIFELPEAKYQNALKFICTIDDDELAGELLVITSDADPKYLRTKHPRIVEITQTHPILAPMFKKMRNVSLGA
jgi:hypothetical protein